jgi:hypothetical protein
MGSVKGCAETCPSYASFKTNFSFTSHDTPKATTATHSKANEDRKCVDAQPDMQGRAPRSIGLNSKNQTSVFPVVSI